MRGAPLCSAVGLEAALDAGITAARCVAGDGAVLGTFVDVSNSATSRWGFVRSSSLAGARAHPSDVLIHLAANSKDKDDDDDGSFQHWDRIAPVIVINIAFAFTLVRMAWHTVPKRSRKRALADHDVVPGWAKVLVPLMMWTMVTLFAFSNSTLGARVKLTADVGGVPLVNYKLFDFSLANTVREMFQAEVYGLATLVLVWSGIWPYLKAVLMLATWYVPPTWLRPDHRRNLLLSLDVLGKWALIDLFLMTCLCVAFRFHITTETLAPRLLGDFVVVDVAVSPERGLFTLVTAVAISLLCNHFILAFHRNACGVDNIQDGSDGTGYHEVGAGGTGKRASVRGLQAIDEHLLSHDALRRESIDVGSDSDEEIHRADAINSTTDRGFKGWCQCPDGSWFERGTFEAYRSGDARAIEMAEDRVAVLSMAFSSGSVPSIFLDSVTGKLRSFVTPLLCFGLFAAFVLISLSVTEDTFEFVFKGLAGDAIRIVDPAQERRRCSVISIAEQLGSDSAGDANTLGVFYLQSMFVLFAVAFPLIVLVWAGFALTTRLRLRELKIAFYGLEVVTAWQSLDVLIVAIIASIVQIKKFAQFLEGDLCDPIRAVTKMDCFVVQTELLAGCWIVVFTAVYSWLLVQFVLRFLERAIAEREAALLQLCTLVTPRHSGGGGAA